MVFTSCALNDIDIAQPPLQVPRQVGLDCSRLLERGCAVLSTYSKRRALDS